MALGRWGWRVRPLLLGSCDAPASYCDNFDSHECITRHDTRHCPKTKRSSWRFIMGSIRERAARSIRRTQRNTTTESCSHVSTTLRSGNRSLNHVKTKTTPVATRVRFSGWRRGAPKRVHEPSYALYAPSGVRANGPSRGKLARATMKNMWATAARIWAIRDSVRDSRAPCRARSAGTVAP